MSDIIKWGLLVAGFIAIIALIVALPIFGVIDLGAFGDSISVIVSTCSGYFRSSRGILNYFTTEAGAYAMTAILAFKITKTFVTMSIKFLTWIYHFIFK